MSCIMCRASKLLSMNSCVRYSSKAGLRGGIAGAGIIERLDNAGAGQITPKPVGIAGGEEPIVRAW